MTKKREDANRTIGYYVLLAVKGVCMGAANVIPGVSGGTIAFITGIYQDLIQSIKSIDTNLFKMLFQGNLRSFWHKLNGNFLLAILCGVVLAIFSLAKLMLYLLNNHPIPIWSFFIGLVVASAIYVLKSLKGLNFWGVLIFVVGIGAVVLLSKLSPADTPKGYWFIFITGAVAICTMILPGISGSFVMMLMGMYHFIMEAVNHLYWDILFVFTAGALLGIISFSHLLSWLLKKYYNQTVCLLAGFMFGSIPKLWPWKEVLEEGVDRNLWPAKYAESTGLPSQTGLVILFILLGFLIVFGIEFFAKRMEKEK